VTARKPGPWQPRTGARCSCRPGVARDNCPTCEGTGWVIDFRAIHREREERNAQDKCIEGAIARVMKP
jgi:hypothetical protein